MFMLTHMSYQVILSTKGGGRVKKVQNLVYVVYGRPLDSCTYSCRQNFITNLLSVK